MQNEEEAEGVENLDISEEQLHEIVEKYRQQFFEAGFEEWNAALS